MAMLSHKTVTVYRNGDENFTGRAITIGPSVRSYAAFLDDVTRRIRSPFGAVRKIFKLPRGKLVRDLDEIEDGDQLVAARAERFQRIQYEAIMDSSTRQRTYIRPDLNKIKYKQREVKGRNKVDHALTLYCLGNGDKDGNLTQVLLRPRDRSSFEHVLDLITEKLGYKKLLYAAKKLIDLDSHEHITSLGQLQNNHIYVAIDRPDKIEMPSFKVDPETRELIPIVKRTGKRVKNMPIMFEDDFIHGKIYSGEKIIDKRRERTGIDSNVGRVTLAKHGIRRPKELPPIKQPFHVAHTHDTSSFRRTHVKNTPEDRGVFKVVNALIDEETSVVVEEVLQELEHDLMTLLERYIGVKGRKKVDQGRGIAASSSRDAGSSRKPTREPRGTKQDTKASAGPRGSSRSSRRSRKGGDTRTSRKAEQGNIVMASAAAPKAAKVAAATPEPASPSPPPRSPSPPPKLDPVHLYDSDVTQFLEYMAHPASDIFRQADTASDVELRDKLIGAMEAAMAGRLSHWELNPKSAVALVILLDQIPRRVYQGRPKMYDGDPKCQEVIFRLVRTNQQLLQQIKPTTLLFVCIALSHHETREAQAMALQIWKDIKGSFSKDDALHAAQAMTQNREIVEEFGRFPNRNRIVGRANDTHEQIYLDNLDAKRNSGAATGIGRAPSLNLPLVSGGSRKQASRRTLFRRGSSKKK
jgi:uncharacterized protein (DUF924 family)